MVNTTRTPYIYCTVVAAKEQIVPAIAKLPIMYSYVFPQIVSKLVEKSFPAPAQT